MITNTSHRQCTQHTTSPHGRRMHDLLSLLSALEDRQPGHGHVAGLVSTASGPAYTDNHACAHEDNGRKIGSIRMLVRVAGPAPSWRARPSRGEHCRRKQVGWSRRWSQSEGLPARRRLSAEKRVARQAVPRRASRLSLAACLSSRSDARPLSLVDVHGMLHVAPPRPPRICPQRCRVCPLHRRHPRHLRA